MSFNLYLQSVKENVGLSIPGSFLDFSPKIPKIEGKLSTPPVSKRSDDTKELSGGVL